MQNLLEWLFSPLTGLDIESLYNQHQPVIDFILYLCILVYASRVALSRIYPGTHGRKLGIIVGTILAISLSAAQRSIGFSIKSFGPIAAGIIILVVSLVMYNLMRQVGAGHMAGGSISLIVTYFTMRAVSPGFFLWAQRNEWAGYLHMILSLAVIISVWRVIFSIFGSDSLSNLKQAASASNYGVSEFVESYKQGDLSGIGTVKAKLEKLTIKGKRECKKVIAILEQVLDILGKHGSNPKVIRSTSKVLNDILSREHTLKSELARIREVNEDITGYNLSKYDDLAAGFNRLSKEQKAKVRTLLAEEREKTGYTETIRGISLNAQNYLNESEQCIRQACKFLAADQSREALALIRRSIDLEKAMDLLLDDLWKQEKMLVQSLRKHIARLEASK
ncbi:MAG: hypothetical protein OEY67_10095 [Gammaproteobacteria bacterium]|nr:hypothetical protein [Gammaproteobacteria bacterium]